MTKLIVATASGTELREMEVPVGAPVRFGRMEPSEQRFPGDGHMSRVHFSLEFDGRVCRLKDLGSTNGVFFNGVRVPEAVLESGQTFLAGQTTFTVRVEGEAEEAKEEAPAPAGASFAAPPVIMSSDEPLPPDRQRLLELMRAETTPLFALLDAARDGLVLEFLHHGGVEFQCLYEGQSAEDLEAFAPYLAAVPRDSRFLELLLRKAWGQSWGMYAFSKVSLAELRKHFRRFLTVEVEGQGTKFFRFYDPRPMRVFLPSMKPEDARDFFGPVEALWMEGEEPKHLLKFLRGEKEIVRQVVDLENVPSPQGTV